jgi:zeaxanthin glucosyltransferase
MEAVERASPRQRATPQQAANSTRPLVVFIVSWFSSHVLAAVGLARRIRAAGYDVELWAERNAAQLICDQGFVFRELKSLWHHYEPWFPAGPEASLPTPKILTEALRTRRNRRRALHGALSLFERSLDRALAPRVPVLAVFDPFVLAYHGYLRRLGVRCVALGDKPLPIVDRFIPPPTTSLAPRRTAAGWARVHASWCALRLTAVLGKVLTPLLRACGVYTPEDLLAEIQRRTGPPGPGDRVYRGPSYDLHFRSVDEWVLGLPQADLRRDAPLPSNVRYIGLCVDDERYERGARIARLPSTRYLIYVAMGTAMPRWDADVRLLTRIVEAVRDLPEAQIVVAAGGERAATELRARTLARANVEIHAVVAQLSALAVADLVITHGGANTFRECLVACTPMLVFPRDFDQPGNAARVIHLGIGLKASRSFSGAACIRRKALRILEDPLYRLRVSQLSAASRQIGWTLLYRELADQLGENPAALEGEAPRGSASGRRGAAGEPERPT